MKYRVLEIEGDFYPQFYNYVEESWDKFYDYDEMYTVSYYTLEEAYEFLSEQIPTQFVHPFPV